MLDYQQSISEVLEQCQNLWLEFEQYEKDNMGSTAPMIHRASRDLRDGIKQLVQLQDNLDEIGNIVENNTEWRKKADKLIEDVNKRLTYSKNVFPLKDIVPTSTISSPLRLSVHKKKKSSIHSISEEEEEEDDQFIDASDELGMEQELKDMNKNEPISSSDYINAPFTRTLSSSSSASSSSSKSIEKPFGRRSVLADDMIDFNTFHTQSNSNDNKKKGGLFPLLKGLRPSQSTPVKTQPPAQINFYKNDNKPDSNHYIFATDAIVNHPLRVGAGYGSYICYNCTILSDKGAPITVRKRYSDFIELRDELLRCYPALKKSIPKLPPKKVVGKFSPAFVEQRRRDLEYFFKYVVLHPTLGASAVVRHWIAP
ncbi:Phox-like protein [Backusella circina FSU 941]|nr:Phox-like protein [Backusella circina FSU 941]